MPSPNIFDLFKKKNQLKSQKEMAKIVLEVKVSCNTNFQIQYPIKDNQPIIKEFYGNHWNQEIALFNPANAYLKVFISKPIGITQATFVKLKLHDVRDNETKQQIFSFEEDATMAMWLKVDWHIKSLSENSQDMVEY